MRHILNIICLASIILFAVQAFATPTPSTYDDAAWKSFIEQGKNKTIPKGMPTGPGAISGYHGLGFWSVNYVTIQKPFDMSKNTKLVFSNKAIASHEQYASESMKLFLEATLAQAEKLSKNKDFQLPVYELYHEESIVAYERTNLSKITFGFYTFDKENNSAIQPGAYMRKKDVRAQRMPVDSNYQRYSHFQTILKKRRPELQAMTDADFRAEIIKISSEVKDLQAADRNQWNDEIIEISDTQAQALAKLPITKFLTEAEAKDTELNAIIKRIAEVDDEMESLREILKTSTDNGEKEVVSDQFNELNDERKKLKHDNASRKQAIRDQVFAEHKELSDEFNQIVNTFQNDKKTIYKNRSAEREAKNKEYERLGINMDETKNISTGLIVDLEKTWIMIESMLTQNVIPVMEITMPEELKNKLTEYANGAKKSADLIKSFDLMTKTSGSRIVVKLACSVRDRFLGCQEKGDNDIEQLVSNASTAMLKAAENLPEARQLEILKLVANANPEQVGFMFDTTKLRNKYVTDTDAARSLDYHIMLMAIEHLNVNGKKNNKKVNVPEGVKALQKKNSRSGRYKNKARKNRNGRLEDDAVELPF